MKLSSTKKNQHKWKSVFIIFWNDIWKEKLICGFWAPAAQEEFYDDKNTSLFHEFDKQELAQKKDKF